MKKYRPIQKLSEETARKIAAGEVIDRPAAIVRELLDNAIDSKASSITVEIDGGGIDCIRISDNGFGMSKEDLENCAQTHATSKIQNVEDLLSLETLGFRGEALVSISAVSTLEISSIREGASMGFKLEATNTSRHISPIQWNQGTSVMASSLFENIPARRIFLKKPFSEAKLCKQTFIEKALPWNAIGFKYIQDGKEKFFLPQNQSKIERFTTLFDFQDQEKFFHEINYDFTKDKGFSFSIVLAEPTVHRVDKKNILLFINGRRIWEYSLIQAIEYGATGYFPNGTFPVAALFLTIDPKLIDFNIHPAKREVRFKDIAPVHHEISTAVRKFYQNKAISFLTKEVLSLGEKENDYAQNSFFEKEYRNSFEKESAFLTSYKNDHAQSLYEKTDFAHFERSRLNNNFAKKTFDGANIFSNSSNTSPYKNDFNSFEQKKLNENQFGENAFKISGSSQNFEIKDLKNEVFENDIKYFGVVLGTFLLVEKNSSLYFIDQHAAHERILFNKFMNNLGDKQKLLFAYVIETETEEDDKYLETLIEPLNQAGFELQNEGSGIWEITAIPTKWSGTENDLKKDLLQKRLEPKDIIRSIAASSSCRMAVKDGTILDPQTAKDLAKEALALSDPHCPHGRPIYTKITKEELFLSVRRTES